MEQTPIHEAHNPDLLGAMHAGYRGVVEVGSSSGAMARAYREANPSCHYVGIEIDPAYADASRRYCSEVLVGNAEALDDAQLHSLCQNAQCWVFGDALEHLYDPWKLLRRIRGLSATGTEVAACIPNAQYWGIQSVLNSGLFLYQDAGLLDRTHIRWFTRLTMVQLFQSTGFQVEHMVSRVGNLPNDGQQAAIRQMASASGHDPDMALSDAMAFQYVLRAVAV